ncbi:MAG: DUF262 domain-containing protein [Methylococcales bacterium]|nr:DUF262 domain-containing protein [Methylococcales bacterium]
MTEIIEKNKVLNLYPIDYPFETLISRATSDPIKLHLNPDFQRKYKWDKDGNERGSKFIESCLMRIPLPACYFAERDDSTHDVIDGVQRITTILKFFNDEFALENLTIFKELEGKKFSELGDLKNELESTTIRCVILRKENPKSLVNEIFARLNQGAVKLEPQEIRHAVYPGTFDKLLQELGENEPIKSFKATDENSNRENEEMILRYFALQSDLSDYEGNLTRHLNNYMEKNQNISELEIERLRDDFNKTLHKCLKVFTLEVVFRDTTNNRSKHGLIYYDLLMWQFSQLSDEYIDNNIEKIRQAFEDICNDTQFKKTKTSSLQKKRSIEIRRNLFKEKLGLLDEQNSTH